MSAWGSACILVKMGQAGVTSSCELVHAGAREAWRLLRRQLLLLLLLQLLHGGAEVVCLLLGGVAMLLGLLQQLAALPDALLQALQLVLRDLQRQARHLMPRLLLLQHLLRCPQRPVNRRSICAA